MIFSKVTELQVPSKGEKHHIQGTLAAGAQLIGEEPRFGLCCQPLLTSINSSTIGYFMQYTRPFSSTFLGKNTYANYEDHKVEAKSDLHLRINPIVIIPRQPWGSGRNCGCADAGVS